jgi:CPA2 family monovalent cation:H+ antiporter-2
MENGPAAMHHDLSIVVNITMALLAALVGGYITRRLGLPTLVGYLFGGLAIGPFTPGFVGDIASVSQLAEMGVIFMLFGVGLHFSLQDLWAVRKVAIPGAVLQIVFATGLGFGLTQLWGWRWEASLVVGLAISVASTVVLLRGLVDNGLLNTTGGQTAVGWLILEDLATVAILVLLPVLFGSGHANPWVDALWTIAKTIGFVTAMLFIGKKLLPWLLVRTALTRSRELFILAVVTLALGTAMGAAQFFDVSLALGAFLAGVVIGESDLGHQVGAEVLPFREIFAAIFFVSVGMLVDPAVVVANWPQVLGLLVLIVFGKGLLTLLLGLVLPASGHTMLVVAAGLAQIGEFSFLVGQAGLALGVLTAEQYGLIMASSLISIVLNPLAFAAIPRFKHLLQRVPGLWNRLDRHITPPPLPHGLDGHVVVVGYGRVGTYAVNVLQRLEVPLLVVEQDMQRAIEFHASGVPTLVGDASNSEILVHAELDKAQALVVTISDENAAELVVAAAHQMAPELRIIARAGTAPGVQHLARLGASDVIHPELEGGLEIVRHTLLALNYAMGQVQQYIDTVRKDSYEASYTGLEELQLLDQLVATVRNMEIAWRVVGAASPLVGKTLAEANMRAQTGASVIALVRNRQVQANPKSSTVFQVGDLIGLIGEPEQTKAAEQLLDPVDGGRAQAGAAVQLLAFRQDPGAQTPAPEHANAQTLAGKQATSVE